MSIIQILARPYSAIARLLDLMAPLFDLGVRLWVAWVFFKSGLSKIQSWDSTLMLFKYEYEVPLLPPDIAAYIGTAAELGLPVLVAIGLASRMSALALFGFNAVAVIAYAGFLLGDNGAAGLQQHILWGVMLLFTVFHGPGKLSLDHWLCLKR